MPGERRGPSQKDASVTGVAAESEMARERFLQSIRDSLQFDDDTLERAFAESNAYGYMGGSKQIYRRVVTYLGEQEIQRICDSNASQDEKKKLLSSLREGLLHDFTDYNRYSAQQKRPFAKLSFDCRVVALGAFEYTRTRFDPEKDKSFLDSLRVAYEEAEDLQDYRRKPGLEELDRKMRDAGYSWDGVARQYVKVGV